MVIPPSPSKAFWRGDIGGVTLPSSMVPPLVPGCNTTPMQMGMSFLLPYYTPPWQDRWLTAHAQRNYSHFHLARDTWQAAGLSDTAGVELMQYLQSWGF